MAGAGVIEIRPVVRGVKETQRALGLYERYVRDLVWEEIVRTARAVRSDARARVPKATGAIGRSIRTRLQKRRLRARVGSDHKGAPALEQGSGRFYQGSRRQRSNAGFRERRPPVEGLRDWARQKGIPPFALAVALQRQGGTRAQPFLEPARRAHALDHERRVARAVLRTAARKASGTPA